MKNYLMTILALVAMLLCGCKDEHKSDPVSDDGNRDYSIRIYVSQDIMDYINTDVYLTLPESAETKLTLDNPVALDQKIDAKALGDIALKNLSSSDFRVYVSTMKGKKGEYKLRWDYSVRNGVSLPEKINFIKGFALIATSPTSTQAKGDVQIYKGYKTANIDSFLVKQNRLVYTDTIR